MKVMYVDTDPLNGEYIIVREDGRYYYVYIDYDKFEVTEIEEVESDVDVFAFENGLMEIDPVPLDVYLNKLKSLFGQ